jgi:hypothetical protein
MKLALIADIHGNLFAFDAVLEDIRRRKIEQILCLGDVVTCGPQPREALARLREIGCPTVMGNTDAWVVEPRLREYPDLYGQHLQDVEYWASQQLTDQDKAFLSTFEPTIAWPLDEKTTLLAYHGSYNNLVGILKKDGLYRVRLMETAREPTSWLEACSDI